MRLVFVCAHKVRCNAPYLELSGSGTVRKSRGCVPENSREVLRNNEIKIYRRLRASRLELCRVPSSLPSFRLSKQTAKTCSTLSTQGRLYRAGCRQTAVYSGTAGLPVPWLCPEAADKRCQIQETLPGAPGHTGSARLVSQSSLADDLFFGFVSRNSSPVLFSLMTCYIRGTSVQLQQLKYQTFFLRLLSLRFTSVVALSRFRRENSSLCVTALAQVTFLQTCDYFRPVFFFLPPPVLPRLPG